MRDDRPQHRRGEQALRVAERGVEQPPRAERHRQRGHHARDAPGQPLPERVRTGEREQAARARDEQPQRLGRVAERRQQRRDRDGERLPGRAALRVEREVGGAVAPQDPHLRVERERPREQQRERGERHARRDQRAFAGHARWAEWRAMRGGMVAPRPAALPSEPSGGKVERTCSPPEPTVIRTR